MRPSGQNRRVVEILNDVIFAPEIPNVLIEQMAHPSIKIVSLTVTEKGYCHVPSTGALDVEHPDIKHDVEMPSPKTAVGFLVRALERRRERGLRPFTVLSCDNLPDNGRVCRNVVTGLAGLIDPELGDWIRREACFPSTMVDRIVPATTQGNIAKLSSDVGYLDQAPVFHEPFLQWVIEDNFVGGDRLQFERVPGVQMVRDVAPFEFMKIRMLNGTHSTLAYLGYLAGHATIADTVANPVFKSLIGRVWTNEIIPTLRPPEGVDLQLYANELLERFSNPAVRHRTWQIAMDGSQKLPQRILSTLADNVTAGRSSDGLVLAVAAWMRYVGGTDETGQPIDVRDPLADRLRALSNRAQGPSETVDALLSVTEIFGADVDTGIRDGSFAAYSRLVAVGASESARAIT